MAIKTYFTGKTGLKFWGSLLLMLLIIVAVPVVSFYLLDTFTHHGEKIEVPSVIGKLGIDAEEMLKDRGLVCVIADSAYDKRATPGSVLDQTPKAGSEVKSGRVVYVTLNLKGEPMVIVPKIDGSLREVQAALTTRGFKLTANEVVYDRDKDLVIGVKQGVKMIHAGENVARDRAVTIIVGGGEMPDSLKKHIEEEEEEEVNNDFDIEL